MVTRSTNIVLSLFAVLFVSLFIAGCGGTDSVVTASPSVSPSASKIIADDPTQFLPMEVVDFIYSTCEANADGGREYVGTLIGAWAGTLTVRPTEKQWNAMMEICAEGYVDGGGL